MRKGPTGWTTWLVVAIALGCGCEARDRAKPAAELVVASPVTDLDGDPVDPLAPDDRIDALVFVRTDCPISNRYAPELARIATRFAD